MADKDLAEFVIHLALESEGVAAFKSALASNGAIFPAAFADRLHEMVQRVPVLLSAMNRRLGSVVCQIGF
jgi:hypothetical protein